MYKGFIYTLDFTQTKSIGKCKEIFGQDITLNSSLWKMNMHVRLIGFEFSSFHLKKHF